MHRPQRSRSYHCQGKYKQQHFVPLTELSPSLKHEVSYNIIFCPLFYSAITATLMTSVTTSVGFFATSSSDVPGIQLFGAFCGILIVVDYILSVLLLSPVLCLYDMMMMSDSPSRFVTLQKNHQLMERNASRSDVLERDEELTETAETHQNFRDRFLGSYTDFLYEFR